MRDNPLSDDQCARVVARTVEYIDRSRLLFSRRFETPPVYFDLRGRAAGMYCIRGDERIIRYNPFIFANQFEQNLAETVPHEVAHYVTEMIHGARGVRPHGTQWKQVMEAFGVAARVRGEMDLSGVPVRTYRKYIYRCGCRSHELTSIRHNRVEKGRTRYGCRSCGGWLRYADG